MSSTEKIPFHVEMNRIVELLAKQIYQSPLALLRENCQNAFDAILQRIHLGQSFDPEISISITPTEIKVTDNGIGMTKEEMIKNYWRAGASGKNNPEARAAGVVGTFGIGAMANFGIASELSILTESARTNERTRSEAVRDTLSATEDCIQLISEPSLGQPGTTVVARIPASSPIDVNGARAYIKDCVRFLNILVLVNSEIVSRESFALVVPKVPAEWTQKEAGARLGGAIQADIEMLAAKNGDVWIQLENLTYQNEKIRGEIILRQGTHQIRSFRSRFALATAAVSSHYHFGGIANIVALEPTAGREALTTASIQLLQTIVTETEKYVSEHLASSPLSDLNDGFMEWVSNHSRFELCGNLTMRLEPENRSITLEEVKTQSQSNTFNVYEGTDKAILDQYATEENPLLSISNRQPRKRCELAYLERYCKINRISNAPTILFRKKEREWTIGESSFSLRLASILESDYFVKAKVSYGKISHNLSIFVDTSTTPIEILLDSDSSTISTILKLYDTDFMALTGIAKDFVRNVIFSKISHLVPSSTRHGAEAFLRAIRRPRDVFEYEMSDLGNLSEIWQDYLEGKLTLEQAAHQSTVIVRSNVQVLDPGMTRTVASVLQDVIDNEKLLKEAEKEVSGETAEALPAITRLEIESPAKLLTIPDEEPALKGYRCFLAIPERIREDRAEFFLQPHRTEIVWGGQRVLYIFQHHSGEFGLYYELQGLELFANSPGGRSFPTCTIVLKNQIYFPVPDEIRHKFIPSETARKRFEIRCELLYPDSGEEMQSGPKTI